MKLNLVLVFGVAMLVAICAARPADEEYAEYEEEAEPAAPPPKKAAAARPLIGRRNPLAGRNNNKATSTTTTTPASKEEEVAEEADYEEEQPQEETSSTTEAPKKFIKSGIVRPFRSNDDLLATLKRRREQVVSNKSKPVQIAEGEESAPAAVEREVSKPRASSTSGGRRNRFSKDKNTESEPAAAGAEEPSTAAPARTGRRFHGRS